MPNDRPTITFRPTSSLLDEVERRTPSGDTSRHQTAKRDLKRYYRLLSRACPTLPSRRHALGLVEVITEEDLIDALLTARHLEGLLEETVPELAGLAQEWTYLECLAAVDAVEAYHNGATLEETGLVASEERA